MINRLIPCGIAWSMWLGACGDTYVDPTIAKAVQTENKMEQAQKALEEQRKKEAQEKKRAAQEKEQKKEAELEAATRLPEEMPADLDAACDALLESYDDFMRRGNEKDALDWYQGGRRTKLAIVRRDRCERVGSIPAAACGGVALMEQLTSLAEMDRTEAANLVLNRCREKFLKT
jgi:hypothetical protein